MSKFKTFLAKSFLDFKHPDAKVVLLYRFHITVILVNLFAIFIDLFYTRYTYASIEALVIVVLALNLWNLRLKANVKVSAYIFIALISITLFTSIYLKSFATMSVVFVLLLPLTTLLFIRFSHSLFIELALFSVMGILLYIEYLNNPVNPLFQNPQALFNLAYTAIIIYVFGLLYHFSIVTTFEELDESNYQKELLLKEVHHRVKNNLNVIASIIGLQANSLKEHEKEQLLKSKTRIESIAMVHEMLYKCDDFENIDFQEYMQHLSKLLLGMYAQNQKVHVEVRGSYENILLPLDVMVQLGIMANELITNSIKYAFDSKEGNIYMHLDILKQSYIFTYSDDGIGCSDIEALRKSKSLGIKLIHLTARQLNGEVELSSPKGLLYKIEFKHE